MTKASVCVTITPNHEHIKGGIFVTRKRILKAILIIILLWLAVFVVDLLAVTSFDGAPKYGNLFALYSALRAKTTRTTSGLAIPSIAIPTL